MKIQCDVCERSPATVICCADEAALCAKCDVEVHAANKLASKHQRLLLQCLSNKLPRCDICQEKAAFIFCVQDRALFCQDCDEPIHSAGSLAANHQRFLATGIRVDLSSNCTKSTNKIRSLDPPRQNDPLISVKLALQQQISTPSEGWGMDELLQLSELNSTHDMKDEIHFGEVDWLSDMGIFGEQIPQEPMAAAEVPQLPILQTGPYSSPLRSTKLGFSQKNARTEYREHYDDDEEEEHFTVPDLG